MRPFVADIEELTEENEDFRHVVHTGAHMQLVLMTLQAGQELGLETHADHDQFFRIEEGWGKVVISGKDYPVLAGWGIVVPAGSAHNLINSSNRTMTLYTIYAPPQHAAGLIQHEKEASADPEQVMLDDGAPMVMEMGPLGPGNGGGQGPDRPVLVTLGD